ncbi:MAG: response regulator [Halieaceae bacterium]|jgi:signal transduction histidine kinase/CheY-like chemotaxis protein/HPt (histidine-containing phosphotransfer) domain-containing protein|nr:response regulator [Halieaceae bacterium]
MSELRLARDQLEQLFTVLIAIAEDGSISYASSTAARYVEGLSPGTAFFDHFDIVRPGSINTVEGLLNPPPSLFLIRDRRQRFAARGQLVNVTWDGLEYACFCGSPWLFWMDTNCPDIKLGIEDFPPQDSQLDQLFLMNTEQRMVADLEKLNSELQVAKRAAEEAQVAKSALFARMSHEMRTPLNGVVSALALLSDRPLPEEARKLLRLADSSSRNLLHVINYVLDISRLEIGNTELDPVLFNLSGLLKSVTDIVRARAVEKGLELTWHTSPQLNETYIGDKAKLRQCLLNLVTNAIRFTPAGSIVVRAAPSTVGDGDMLRLEVEDTGIGIRHEDQKRIFQPFWTGSGDLAMVDRGTGLGLDIVRRNVEAMGGQIGVASRIGKGSLFWMELPLEPAEEIAQEDVTRAASGSASLRGRVLLVDDNETNLLLGRMILESLGLSVLEARDGSSAVSRCHGEAFDLVLMDISMPDMDGIAATREIRRFASREQLPIVALTAYASSEERERCLDTGMNEYLTKPIVRDRLAEQLAQWLASDDSATEAAPELALQGSSDAPALDEAVLATLRAQIGDSNLGTVLDQFRSEVSARWEATRSAWQRDDPDTVRREVHTLSSTCRSLGLLAAGEHFSELEGRLRDGIALTAEGLGEGEALLREGVDLLLAYRSEP